MKRLVAVVLFVVVCGLGAFGMRYVYWVENWGHAEDPFDELGIDLHQHMPGFVQAWGCARLKVHFGDKTLPPYGCADPANPHHWPQDAALP